MARSDDDEEAPRPDTVVDPPATPVGPTDHSPASPAESDLVEAGPVEVGPVEVEVVESEAVDVEAVEVEAVEVEAEPVVADEVVAGPEEPEPRGPGPVEAAVADRADAAPVGIVAGEEADPERDQVDFTAITKFLRFMGFMAPLPAKERILVPQREGVLVPAAGPGDDRPPLPPRPEPDDLDQVNLSPVIEWARGRDPVRWTLFGIILVWSLLFIHLGWRRHAHFGTFGFDLGVYDQAVWLLSRFKEPFITMRGLTLFGFHMNPILVLLAPFYWLGAGPQFLLVVQVAAQASGAVAVYLLARDRIGDRWLAVALASVLLLHPTYQYLTWEYFHPDALAIAPLLFAYWAARAKRWGWFTVSAVLAVACKEDVALALAVMGVLIFFWGHRRAGAITALASVVWFALVTKWILPSMNGITAFYDTFFGDFGSSPTEVVKTVLTKPGKAYDTATLPDRMNYYRMMFAPVAFLPLAAPSTLLIAGPMLAINILSTFPYQREIRYHYAALVLAGIILATVEAVAKLGKTPGLRRFFVGLLLVTSFGATVAWGPSPVSVKYHSGLWPQGVDPRLPAKQAAIRIVPPREATSAIYYLAPHLTQRTKIYEFPVPWRNINWGVMGENLDDPADVEWLVLDRTLLNADDQTLVAQLLTEEFVMRFDQSDIFVAERVKAPAP